VVVPARRQRRRAQDLAAQRRPWRPGGAGGAAYNVQQNRWFDHYLFSVPNGIQGEPKSTIQREDGSYSNETDWPAPGTSDATLEVGSRSRTAPGTLSAKRPSAVPQTFTDNGRNLDTDDVLIKGADAADPNRLVYRTSALSGDVRMSGTPWVDLRMSVDNRTAANLTARQRPRRDPTLRRADRPPAERAGPLASASRADPCLDAPRQR